jgi:superfamily II DNA helicase RecQ
MPYRVFSIPVRDSGSAEQELNSFMASHSVLSIDRRFVELGENSYWTFCIDFLPQGTPRPSTGRGAAARGKVDYRERLTPDDFLRFTHLRDLRKQIAAADAVPVYTIFSNEQLAQMVPQRATSRAALEQIAGVGDARIDKYGPRFLERLTPMWSGSSEASRPAV